MKIINKTHWQTAHLRAFIAPLAAEELTQKQRAWLRLTFVYKARKPRQRAIPGPDEKLEHAEKMLSINERKLKRFTTICKRWRLKVRYYERRKAAMTPPQEPTA